MADNPSNESELEFKKEIKRQFERSSKDELERLIPKRGLDKYRHLPPKTIEKGSKIRSRLRIKDLH